jgi:hypothetical protein
MTARNAAVNFTLFCVPLSPDHYTVGWIAALPIERAAATALLDERHHEPQGFSQNQSDMNSYTWGRIGEHNIGIASLPAGVGTSAGCPYAHHGLASHEADGDLDNILLRLCGGCWLGCLHG